MENDVSKRTKLEIKLSHPYLGPVGSFTVEIDPQIYRDIRTSGADHAEALWEIAYWEVSELTHEVREVE